MNEQVQFLRQPPSLTAWQRLIQICEEKRVDPKIVVRPDDFREHRYAAQRMAVVKELLAKEMKVAEVAELCGLSERRVREAE